VPADADPLVLIVDDDAATREAFSLILSIAGCRVQSVADGLEALVRLRNGERPRLIVLDLMMPGMDGLTLQRILSGDEQLSGVPVVVCTAGGAASRARFATPPAAFLEKPIDPTDLVSAVKGQLSPAY
jgi:CheY-like chemotaxis protein